jgi:hypothetical protein
VAAHRSLSQRGKAQHFAHRVLEAGAAVVGADVAPDVDQPLAVVPDRERRAGAWLLAERPGEDVADAGVRRRDQ